MEPSRNDFLVDLMAALDSNPAYTAAWGPDTDVTIESNPVDASWGSGTDRVEYSAAVRAVEDEGAVYFWELLRERAAGPALGADEIESGDALAGTDRFGADADPVVGPGSKSWEWGYGTLRALVDDIAVRRGFTVRAVLTRDSALW